MQFSSLPINSSLQNNPRYQFSLKSENIEILPIVSAAIQSLRIWSDKFIRRRRRGRIIITIITRFDCVWMQTQKSPNDTHIRIRACGSSLQNTPRYQFSLKSENIEILPILSAAIRSRFFCQNILSTLLNISAKSCGNPFGSFRYK